MGCMTTNVRRALERAYEPHHPSPGKTTFLLRQKPLTGTCPGRFRRRGKWGWAGAIFEGRILSTLGGLPPEKIASTCWCRAFYGHPAFRLFCGRGAPVHRGKQPEAGGLRMCSDAGLLTALLADDLCARMGSRGPAIAGLAA
jgi:hypothetical protein